MPRDKKLSHERIIQAAFDEFNEYGYEKASMRSIGNRCGLTAAALYRHFESKEALFDALVRSAAADLNEWVHTRLAATEESARIAANENTPADTGDLWNDIVIAMMKELIYPRKEEYSLLFTKAAGSVHSDYLNDFVTRQQESISGYLDAKKRMGCKVMDVTPEELHILIKSYCIALFEPIAKGCSLDEALERLETIDAFYKPAWRKLMGSDK